MTENLIETTTFTVFYGGEQYVIDGLQYFRAVNSDPQLLPLDETTRQPLALTGGLYQVAFRADVVEGSILAPCLYVDTGSGYSEDPSSKILLADQGNGVWEGVAFLHRAPLSLRFDPSVSTFAARNLRLSIKKMSNWRMTAFSTATWVYRRVLPHAVRARVARGGVTRRIAETILSVKPPPNAQTHFTAAVHQEYGAAESGIMDPLSNDYRERMFAAKGGRISQYAAITSLPATANPPAVFPIAYYLPQMHPFPENDQWWGRGFTEWTNVSKAVAQFRGHYQPKLPGELGYYDLRLPEVMARQIELAKLYGLHGFCFYYYWFAGKRLLEKPLNMLVDHLGDDRFDFPFCLCWANENWTRRWDGAEHEVLMAQSHSETDHVSVFHDLLRYWKDPRYIRVEGRPVILIYRPSIIPDVEHMLAIWRDLAIENGLPGLYIVCTNSFGFSEPEKHGFDALCGFPPHGLESDLINDKLQKINSEYAGYVFSYSQVADWEINRLDGVTRTDKATFFPGVMTAWDNEARKPSRGNVFHDSTPRDYRRWLMAAGEATQRLNEPDRRFVFVNAWNEWAEGAYLEPDRRFGYAYLAATADVVREMSARKDDVAALAAKTLSRERQAKTAVCLHVFYPEMIEEFADVLAEAQREIAFDVIVTVPDTWAPADCARVIETLKPVRLLPVTNRGRDVMPFLSALACGVSMGYEVGCKLHSKKSPQHTDGDDWRKRLLNGLLGSAVIARLKDGILAHETIGMAAPAAEVMNTQNHFHIRDNLAASLDVLSRAGQGSAQIAEFVAGTMFWFRFGALGGLAKLGYTADDFGPELGQIDGTLAHAFERVFATYVTEAGYTFDKYAMTSGDTEAEAKRD